MFKIEKINQVKVFCLGDVMLDRYLHSSVSRISPEGPVPVATVVRSDNVAGGVANVAQNIAALGAQVTICGVVGCDTAGHDLKTMLSQNEQITVKFVETNQRPTTEKTRFVAQGQQLLRADQENAEPIAADIEDEVMAVLAEKISQHDVVVLSDYAKGVLTKRILDTAISIANQHKIPVIVDPKSADFTRYAKATVITPNSKEIFDATGIKPNTNEAAEEAGCQALKKCQAEALLITRAEQGMSLVWPDKKALHIGAAAREVFDVVGAGDTVVATLAVFLGAGCSLEKSAQFANMAAGIVVGKAGTATVSMYELIEALKQQEMKHDPQSSIKHKILTQLEMQELCSQWKAQGLTVGFTNGCFDLLHVGHVSLLTFARAQCDKLIVGLNSDASVRRLKGVTRPVNPENDRSYVLAALQAVDAVVIFEEDTPQNIIENLTPDVLIKGADYSIEQIVGAKHVLEHGGCVKTFELVPGKSSTGMIEKAKQSTNS